MYIVYIVHTVYIVYTVYIVHIVYKTYIVYNVFIVYIVYIVYIVFIQKVTNILRTFHDINMQFAFVMCVLNLVKVCNINNMGVNFKAMSDRHSSMDPL